MMSSFAPHHLVQVCGNPLRRGGVGRVVGDAVQRGGQVPCLTEDGIQHRLIGYRPWVTKIAYVLQGRRLLCRHDAKIARRLPKVMWTAEIPVHMNGAHPGASLRQTLLSGIGRFLPDLPARRFDAARGFFLATLA